MLHEPAKPVRFFPITGPLAFRRSQLPAGPGESGGTEPFQIKCDLAVALLRPQARIIVGKHLGVFGGGYALWSVIRRSVLPEDASPRLEFLTRLLGEGRPLTFSINIIYVIFFYISQKYLENEGQPGMPGWPSKT